MAVWDNDRQETCGTSAIKPESRVKIKQDDEEKLSEASNPISDAEFYSENNPIVQAKDKISTDVDSGTEWSLCLSDRVILLRQDANKGYLYFKALPPTGAIVDNEQLLESTEEWLRDYLNLQVPLDEMYKKWAEKDKVFARFATRFAGIRMLRQDPWECLCA